MFEKEAKLKARIVYDQFLQMFSNLSFLSCNNFTRYKKELELRAKLEACNFIKSQVLPTVDEPDYIFWENVIRHLLEIEAEIEVELKFENEK